MQVAKRTQTGRRLLFIIMGKPASLTNRSLWDGVFINFLTAVYHVIRCNPVKWPFRVIYFGVRDKRYTSNILVLSLKVSVYWHKSQNRRFRQHTTKVSRSPRVEKLKIAVFDHVTVGWRPCPGNRWQYPQKPHIPVPVWDKESVGNMLRSNLTLLPQQDEKKRDKELSYRRETARQLRMST